MDYIFVNKILKTPIYKQIAYSIISAIEKGDLIFNDKLPTEKEICQTFSISPTVVKMAYDFLISDGKIKRIKGKGTYVTNRSHYQSPLHQFYQVDKVFTDENDPYDRQVILVDYIDDDYSAYRMLKLNKGEHCFVFIRIIKNHRNPVLFQKIYLPEKYFPKLESSDLENHRLFDLISNKQTQPIDHLHNTFSPINASSAEALLLNIQPDDAIYFVRTLLIGQNNHVLGYVTNYFPGEFTEFEVMVHAI